MSHHSTDAPVNSTTPARPLEVCCPPAMPEPATPTRDRAPLATAAPAGASTRTIQPPGRLLDAIMLAFREQRRLAQEQGESTAVIEQILTRGGPKSLVSDLTRSE